MCICACARASVCACGCLVHLHASAFVCVCLRVHTHTWKYFLLDFEFIEDIPAPTFKFGGMAGSTVTTAVFSKL